uniref:Uncharacterized protein n=1 Tax=Oryza rufipogon TaxID=4529 RepID=A0A0E0R497_ORYRU
MVATGEVIDDPEESLAWGCSNFNCTEEDKTSGICAQSLIISSHPPPRHPSCPILPTTRDCSWMATPSNPSIFVRQMHHGTIIMGS